MASFHIGKVWTFGGVDVHRTAPALVEIYAGHLKTSLRVRLCEHTAWGKAVQLRTFASSTTRIELIGDRLLWVRSGRCETIDSADLHGLGCAVACGGWPGGLFDALAERTQRPAHAALLARLSRRLSEGAS